MKKNNESDDLRDTIQLLEHKQDEEIVFLKDQLHLVSERLQPANMIKRAVHNVATSPELHHIILNSAIGLGIGYCSKKVFVGTSDSRVKKSIGTVLQFTVASIVSQHADIIRLTGEFFLRRLFKKL
jgi:hypothetical protein